MSVKTGKDTKALTAAATAAVGAYFSAQVGANSWWQPVVAAALVGVLAFTATYGVSNDAQTDLTMLARQLQSALHISNLVATTTVPPATAAPASVAAEETQLLAQIPKG